jgi:hypothetical protein
MEDIVNTKEHTNILEKQATVAMLGSDCQLFE